MLKFRLKITQVIMNGSSINHSLMKNTQNLFIKGIAAVTVTKSNQCR